MMNIEGFGETLLEILSRVELNDEVYRWMGFSSFSQKRKKKKTTLIFYNLQFNLCSDIYRLYYWNIIRREC